MSTRPGQGQWKRLLESGRYGSLAELAAAEKIDRSYLSKTLRLTLLAPDVVEAILDGRQFADLALPALLGRLPSTWDEQCIPIEPAPELPSSTTPSATRAAGSAHRGSLKDRTSAA